MSLHRERAAMIEADLQALPTSPLIVAEGTPHDDAGPSVLAHGHRTH